MRLRTTIAILTGLVSTLGPARAFAAPPDDALSSASHGRSSIWLQRDPADRTKRRLVFQDAGAPERVLAITVPERNRHMVSAWAENIALGLDAQGRLAVVLQSRRGLYLRRERHSRGSARPRSAGSSGPGTSRDSAP